MATYVRCGHRPPRRVALAVRPPRAMGSLGDDATTNPLTDSEWRAEMLRSQRESTAWQKRWVEQDEFQRWLQLGATIALPLFAAAWRLLGVRRGWL